MNSAKDRWLTPGEVADLAGVTGETVRRWDEEGTFTADQKTPGGHRRYKESRVKAYLKNPKPPANDGENQ